MKFELRNKHDRLSKQAKYAPARRNTAKWQWYLLVLIIISPIFYFTYKILVESFIPSAEGQLSFTKVIIRAPANGYVKDIFVKQGEMVKRSQELIGLDVVDYDKKIEYLHKEINYLSDKITKTKNPELKELLVMKKESKDYVDELKDNYKTMQALREKKLATIQEMQRSRVDLDNAIIQLHEINKKISQSRYDHVLKMEYYYGQRKRELESELSLIKAKDHYSKITSPFSGKVIDINVGNKEYVSHNRIIMEIATNENMHVKAYLPSKFLSKGIHEGTNVYVKFANGPSKKGVIYSIQRLAEKNPRSNNIIRSEKNEVVLLIKLKEPLDEKHRIYGFPVKVEFSLF